MSQEKAIEQLEKNLDLALAALTQIASGKIKTEFPGPEISFVIRDLTREEMQQIAVDVLKNLGVK